MAEDVSVVILPSPLLPARAYESLRAALAEQVADATIAPSDLTPEQGAGDLIARWADLLGPGTVLVPHSNAGYLAPAVRALRGGTQPIVFLDAALPPPTGTTALAPPRFRAVLRDLAGEGRLLPPWTRWWPREDLRDVIPAASFDQLDRECPRLPLSYFDFHLEVPDSWAAAPNAYLAFGDTYGEEFGFAAARSWPRARLEGGHLHFLHDPGEVASRVLDLLGQLPDRGEGSSVGRHQEA